VEIWKTKIDFQITRFPNFQIERLSPTGSSRR
jgi:hypothetical protein